MVRKIILDTDLGNDVDDVLAMAVLHSLHQQQKIDLDAILISKDAANAPRFADLFNLMVGQPIPIGAADRGVAIPFETYLHLTDLIAERNPKIRAQMQPSYPTATTLLHDRLTAADDQSIDMLTIGFASNLGDFLASADNRALFNRKVARLTMMAGNFEKAQPEFNVMMDIPAFTSLLDHYTGPVDFIGFELGRVRYPEASIRALYERGIHDVIWLPYFSYATRPHHRQCWDPLAALVASGCYDDCFELSEPGQVSVDENKATCFTADDNGKHRYVTLTPVQEKQMKQAMVTLIETL